jgi:3-phosphoshikimate 1-carboxyvinyltransferase
MAGKTITRVINPAKRLEGIVNVPGDKSISHRTAILGSLASGVTIASNFSPGKDCSATLNCLKAVGVRINPKAGGIVYIHGVGTGGFTEPDNVLNAGNSGTTTRLLSGLLAAQPFLSIISGDASLRSRPMKRLIEPLKLMGAEIYGRNDDSLAPLIIKGKQLHGIKYSLPMPSAQIKSAILLAGLFAQGKTIVVEKQISRDHTERLLGQMGANIETGDGYIVLTPLKKPLTAIEICVPGDISSAAYWLVSGAIHPNARLKILNCGINPTRTGIIDILLAMGAKIKVENQRLECNEPVADLTVESSQLKATEIKGEIIPRLIDEIPILAVAACFARGTTIIKDAGELRVKESDRISTTVTELSRLGAEIETLPDGMVIKGGNKLTGAAVKSYSDHRLAMSLAIAALLTRGKTIIEQPKSVDISYPGFWEQLEKITIN